MLITGANGQLGSYLAHCYHTEGYQLALLHHQRMDRISELVMQPGIWSKALDLQDYDAVKVALKELNREMGVSPDILIHCAAIRSFDALPLAQTEPLVFRQVFEANSLACYHMLRGVLPCMQEKRRGRVVIMGSDVTHTGLKNGAAYAAAKSAMVSLVRSCAGEMAPYGVLINAISPGPMETVLEEDYEGDYLRFRQQYFAAVRNQVPTGMLVQMKEIKRTIDLLISDDICNLTGEELMIRGGLK